MSLNYNVKYQNFSIKLSVNYEIKYKYLLEWIEKQIKDKKLEQLFSSVNISEIPIVITTSTKPEKVIYINSNFSDLFGYTLEDLINKDIKCIRDEQKSDETMIVNIKKDGKLVNHRFEVFDLDYTDGILNDKTKYKIGLSYMITPHTL